MIDDPKVRIYWAPRGPITLASARLQCYNIDLFLRNRGWDSTILYKPAHRISDFPISSECIRQSALFQPGDIVVFQKLHGPRTIAAMHALRQRDVDTVFVDCDFPAKTAVAGAATRIVCTSRHLANLYTMYGLRNVEIMPEAYEASSPPRKQMRKGPLQCVWFGSMDALKAAEVEWIDNLIYRKFKSYRLVTVSDSHTSTHVWELPHSWETIARCDISVVPSSDCEASRNKSPNRPIQAMALGLPVIAFPVPSYLGVIEHDRNGYLCRGEEEWTAALTMLGAATNRNRIATSGYRFAKRYFSPSAVADSWCSMFERMSQLERLPGSQRRRRAYAPFELARLRYWAYENLASDVKARDLASASSIANHYRKMKWSAN